jgi:hypothetical protein
MYQKIINYISYDVAILYQSPTDIIDFYIENRVKASKKVSWVHFDDYKYVLNQKLYAKLHKKFREIFLESNKVRNIML